MPEVPATDQASLSEQEFRDFRELILAETGISLADSKRMLVQSRLARRLRILGLQSYRDYYDYVAAGPPHSPVLLEMVNAITTNKTDFFRENHHFEFLASRVVAEARERRAQGAPRRLRVWSAGCSSGEEPYSIAITLLEALQSCSGWDVRILASDIDTEVLAKAEKGIYDGERMEAVPRALLQKYFRRRVTAGGEIFQAKDLLKNVIRFRRINFSAPDWPVHARFDAIFCRNVIIYFNRDLQGRLLERLSQYLEPHGYLMMGHSENLYWINDLLAPVGNTVYRLKKEPLS